MATPLQLFRYCFAVTVLSIFFLTNVCAQQPTFRINYDIASFDLPGGIIQNPNKNYVFAGTNTNFLPLYGNVVELDTIGNVVWARRYVNSLASDIQDIKNTTGGGYIAAGSTDPGLLLMKLNNTGAVTWANSYKVTTTTLEGANRVIQTSDGGYVVAGYIERATPPSSARQDSSNMFCMKVNSAGVVQWAKVFFMTTAYINDHSLNDVAEVSDGYIFGGSMSLGAANSAGSKAIVLKTDFNGNIQWTRQYGSTSSEVTAMVALSSSEVLVAGDDNSRTYYYRLSAAGVATAGYTYTFPGLAAVAIPYNVFVTNDGFYGFTGSYISPLAFSFASYVLKVNPASAGAVSFTRTFSSGLSNILAEGLQAADSGYAMVMLAQQNTGFNYHVVKADKNGLMNNSACESASVTPSKATYNPSFVAITPVEVATISTTSLSMVVTTLTPTKTIDCIKIPCNNPAALAASATPNPLCLGTATTISVAAPVSGITYNIYDASSSGNFIAAAPYTFSPTLGVTYYVESNNTAIPGCVSASRTPVAITVNTPPAAVGVITGAGSPCPSSQAYSIAAVSGATSYTWAVSGGGTITAGQGTTGITINWTGAGNYTVSVTATNSCGSTSNTLPVSVQNGPPAAVSAISGSTAPCPGAQAYSINTVANATSYTWAVSAGGSITAGQGTTSATINWATSGGPYTVSVTATNSCGTTFNTLAVNVQNAPPAAVGTITGNSSPCPGSQGYSIPAVTNATTYTWAVSGGGTITGGQGTTGLTINWTGAGNYTLSVTATNSCGSTSNTLPVSVQTGPPAAVGLLSGSTTPCPGTQTYSISTVANATSYTWAVSAGGTVSAGQGTTSVSINWATSGGPYTVSVTAINGCGNTLNTLAVNVQNAAPTVVGAITGNNNPCPGSQSYSIATVTNATTYAWSINGGGTITSGQGTLAATINWTTAGTYTVSVTASNACGSASNTYAVTVKAAAPTTVGTISGTTTPCPSTQTYAISTVPNATAYTWSISAGGTIISGQGTTSINVNWTTAGGPYSLAVNASNDCGSATGSINVTVGNAAPLTPSTIGGLTATCIGNQPYSISTVANATTYTWSVSSGGTVTGGQGTTAATINWATAGTYTVSVTAGNSCGTSTATTLTVIVTAAAPTGLGTITGTSPVCRGIQVYSVGAATNGTNYNWAVGTPGSILTGQGTTSINVNWPAVAGIYPVTVNATNVCGSSSTASFSVSVSDTTPVSPAIISGNTTPCPGSITYTIQAVNSATNYTWSVSGGGTITSGQGSTSATINWTTTGGPYTILVTANNVCGSSVPTTLTVNVSNGSAPVLGTINGDTLVCPSAQNYSVAQVAGASAYTWTLTAGGTISSGQGTNAIAVNWTQPGANYTLTVQATGTCSNSAAVTLNVTVKPNAPTQPGAITGLQQSCGGTTQTYNIPTVANATTYTWTINNGGTITSGQGTTSVTVDWASTPGTYSLSVIATNDCGSSSATTISIEVLPPAPIMNTFITGDTSLCSSIATYVISNLPNATNYTWTVSPGGTILSGQNSTSISVNWLTAGTQTVSVTASNSCGTSSATSLVVTIQPTPTLPTVNLQDTTICQGTSATLIATNSTGGISTYNYYDAATNGTVLGTSPFTVSPTVTTIYYLEVSNQFGCTISNRIDVTVNVLVSPSVLNIIVENDVVCYNTSTTLTATTTPGSTVTWWDSPINGTQLGSGNSYTTNLITQSTTFYAQATSNAGCQSTEARKPITVEVTALPLVTLTSDKENNTIFPQEAMVFTANPSGYDNYEFFVNGLSVQTGASNFYASAKFSNNDTVTVLATANGCVSLMAEGVVIVADFPNVFTPNGDSKNDVFLKNYDLQVHNRWGQLLYTGLDGWDGTYKGSKVSPGTYFYIVTLNNITDRKNEIKGTVLVIED